MLYPFLFAFAKKKGEKKRSSLIAPLPILSIAQCFSSLSSSLSRFQFRKSRNPLDSHDYFRNLYSLDRFIDSFEFLNNKEYPQIIFRTRSTLGALFKRWNRYGLFTPMRGTFILSEKWIIRRLFDASKLEITVLHPLVTSKRFLFVIVLYTYIYILVAISRARYTVSSDVTWRVAQKTGCQWLEISIIPRISSKSLNN